MNRCHCGDPATWLLMVFPRDDSSRSTDSWAACDAHVADAARQLTERSQLTPGTFDTVLRSEDVTADVATGGAL